MSGDALTTLRRFWDIQDGHDYRELVELFADDAVLVDPVYGTFEGREAIRGFMERVTADMADRAVTFRLVELAGDEETAWAQWQATTPAGVFDGVGVYRVRDGRLTYYRDYMDRTPS
jgi:ketosteroid isomerase-like protein